MKTSATDNLIAHFFRMILIIILAVWISKASAQCVVTSSNGYVVNLTVTPVEVIPNTTSCTYGYNFNYKLNYDISFSGINLPASLYALQGNVLASGFSGNFFDLPNSGGNGTVTSTGNSYTSKTNCNTVTVASLDPSVEIQIEGPGISYRTISCPFTTLPVRLIAFTAKRAEEGILLNWSTGMEKNNKYFTVEKSSDAVHWESLAQVQGAGNSDALTAYVYTDVQPLKGLNYYRLKQTDADGRSVYFNVLSVDNTQLSIETNVYPNPATGSTVTLSISTSSKETIEAEVFNAMGQKLKTYAINAGEEFIHQTIELPESGNMFLIHVLQSNTVIGKHQVLVR